MARMLSVGRRLCPRGRLIGKCGNGAAVVQRRSKWDKSSGYEFMANEGVLVPLFKTFAKEREISRVVQGSQVQATETVLTQDELRPLLRSLGEFPSQTQVEAIFEQADTDKNGVIDLQEFIHSCDKVLHPLNRTTLSVDSIIDNFLMLDSDMDGFISVDDLEGLLTTGGMMMSESEAKSVIDDADKDGNGLVDLNEFVSLVTSKMGSMRQWRLRSGFRMVYVVGGPGCGKGTMCARIVDEAKVRHISCGDILREEVESGTPLGKEIHEIMKQGGLVEPAVVLALLRRRMSAYPGAIILLDGFPRSQQNAADFNGLVGKPSAVIYLDCPPETMVQRIIKRGRESSEGEKRADDNEETAMKRISTFNSQGKPTLEYLETIDVPIVRVDACQSPDDMWNELMSQPNIISNRVKSISRMKN